MSSKIEIERNIFAEDGAKNGAKASVISTMIAVRAQAVTLAPVDEGELANSIMWKTQDETRGFNEAGRGANKQAPEGERLSVEPPREGGVVGTNSDHAIYLEKGTRYQPAQPYMEPAGLIVARSVPAAEVAKRFSRDEMVREFLRRRTRRRTING